MNRIASAVRAMGTSAFFLLLICFIAGCSNGLLDELQRPAGDPVIIEPRVISFESENTITISWDEDSAADSYILYCAEDATVPDFSVVYQGTDTEFQHENRSTGIRYLYRLSKMRGSKEFGPSESVLGVGSNTIYDAHEPNNSRDDAVFLEYQIDANIYYFRADGGQSISDEDWYFVEIPPQRTANITVDSLGTPNYIASGDVQFYREGYVPQDITVGGTHSIANTGYETAEFRFRITPKPSEFVASPPAGGGTVKYYRLVLSSVN